MLFLYKKGFRSFGHMDTVACVRRRRWSDWKKEGLVRLHATKVASFVSMLAGSSSVSTVCSATDFGNSEIGHGLNGAVAPDNHAVSCAHARLIHGPVRRSAKLACAEADDPKIGDGLAVNGGHAVGLIRCDVRACTNSSRTSCMSKAL